MATGDIPQIPVNSKWIEKGIVVVSKETDGADELNKISLLSAFCIDNNRTFIVTDTSNGRLLELKQGDKKGRVIFASQNGELNYPINVIIDHKDNTLIVADRENRQVVRYSRENGTFIETIASDVKCSGLAMDKNGYLYVSDVEKNEIRRWKTGEKEGTLVAGGNGEGDRLDQFNEPRYIFVDENESIYVSDNFNDRVMKWIKDAKEGIIVAGGQGKGEGLSQLSYPHGIVVDQSETVYITDFANGRIMRWVKDAKEGDIIVNNYIDERLTFSYPMNLCFDQENNLYVLDSGNVRILKFEKA